MLCPHKEEPPGVQSAMQISGGYLPCEGNELCLIFSAWFLTGHVKYIALHYQLQALL